MSLRIFAAGHEIEYESFTFPGGEPHVKVPMPTQLPLIDFRPRSFEEFGTLFVVNNVLQQRWNPELFIPYFPGARQDRRTSFQEPITMAVIANLLVQQRFSLISVVDPHNTALQHLIPNLRMIHPNAYIDEFADLVQGDQDEEEKLPPNQLWTGLICPDAGAEKRTFDIANHLKIPNIVYARKHRNMETGALSGFSCEVPPKQGRYLLTDDICDGGGTFLGVAEAFQRQSESVLQENRLDLWVSHGIFSKGTKDLKKIFRKIGCTDSIPQDDSNLLIMPAEKGYAQPDGVIRIPARR